MINESRYIKLCKECNNILLSSGTNFERMAIPWLHVIRAHPIVLNRYNILFKRYFFLRSWLHSLILQLKWIYNLISCFFNGSSNYFFVKKSIAKEVDVLFITHKLSEEQLNKMGDLYFGEVPQMLKKRGLTVSIVSILHFDYNLFSKGNRDKIGGDIYFPKKLNFVKEINIRKRCRKESKKLSRLADQEKSSLRKKILDMASREALSNSTQNSLRLGVQITAVLSDVKPKNLILLLEGHAYEKVVIGISRALHPSLNIISYQHTGLFKYSNSLKNIFSSIYSPNHILTVGKDSKTELSRIFDAHKINVDVMGSNRGKLVIGNAKNSVNIKERKTCLVIPEGFESECNLLFSFSLMASELCPEIDFIWRFHPSMSFMNFKGKYKKFKKLPSNIVISDKALEIDIINSTWVLYRGSTAVLKSISYGLRPFYLKIKDEISIDPLYKMGEFKIEVCDPKGLIDQIKKDMNSNYKDFSESLDKSKKYCENYFTKINMEALNRILT